MPEKTCRDCGNVLKAEARGCPRCALNFEAEDMIDRVIWRRIAPVLFLVILALAVLLYLSR